MGQGIWLMIDSGLSTHLMEAKDLTIVLLLMAMVQSLIREESMAGHVGINEI
jgi:hypothetical protein